MAGSIMNRSESPTDDARRLIMAKILVIEDDKLLCASIKTHLQSRGHEVETVHDGQEGLSRLRVYAYDVAILDWQLPQLSGEELLQQYRGRGGTCPILMLTSNAQTKQKIQGLDAGADDYLTKPFDMDEVHARLQALLRRPTNLFPQAVALGGLEIDIARRTVSRDGLNIKLLPKEFALLEFLLRHADQFFDVDSLLNQVWSSESEATEAAVWQTVKRLRQKLDKPGEESVIVNVKGMGYKVDKSRLMAHGSQ